MVPPTYDALLTSRSTTMSTTAARRYVDDRIVSEDRYRIALGIEDDVLSFTYATVVGFNSMEPPEEYPGFTYFFRMNPSQVGQALFGTVTGDPLLQLPMETGVRGLSQALTHWRRYSGLFLPADDPDLGHVEPRVEVVFQFPVRPELFITQQEDRAKSTSRAFSSTSEDPASHRRSGSAGFEP